MYDFKQLLKNILTRISTELISLAILWILSCTFKNPRGSFLGYSRLPKEVRAVGIARGHPLWVKTSRTHSFSAKPTSSTWVLSRAQSARISRAISGAGQAPAAVGAAPPPLFWNAHSFIWNPHGARQRQEAARKDFTRLTASPRPASPEKLQRAKGPSLSLSPSGPPPPMVTTVSYRKLDHRGALLSRPWTLDTEQNRCQDISGVRTHKCRGCRLHSRGGELGLAVFF